MTNEEQKAWDMFAAAALVGLHNMRDPELTPRLIAEYAGQQADGMMEQRKARMG